MGFQMSEQINLADAASVTGTLDAAEKPDTMVTADEIAAAEQNLQAARVELIEARAVALPAATEHQRIARNLLSEKISAWQRCCGGTPTQADLHREYIAGANAERAARKAGAPGPVQRSQPGPSVIDRSAYYGRGGSANVGRGDGWRRGAHPSQHRGRRVKLPSEQ